MKRLVLCIAVMIMFSGVSMAKEIAGVKFPDTLKAGKEDLVLNGVGLRKKLFIKVYAGGLYVIAPQKDAMKIIAADEPMTFRMVFIYDGVSADKLITGWNEGFANALGDKVATMKKEIDMFNSYFTTEAKKGDTYDIVYVPEQGITVIINDKMKGTIPGVEFKRAVFSIWLGKIPADSGLKEGLLNE